MSSVVMEGVRKAFGKTDALRGLDLVVPAATVLGLLGPNGAGKTTAVRVLTTLVKPDAGRATVDGVDVVAQPDEVRARIGLTGQYAAVDEQLTGRENLELIGRYYHLGGKESKRRSAELLERFDLVEAGNRLAKGYSGGMRRRLDIAMSLIARPSVLFLDEPTTGLDPRSRLAMWELIEELVREGTTTLLTTQYLEEADRLATSIAVIDRGQVIAEGTADELKNQVGGDHLDLTVAKGTSFDDATQTLRPFARSVVDVDRTLRSLGCAVDSTPGLVADVVRAFDAAGIRIEDIAVRRPTLDDVFLTLTGHKAEDDADAAMAVSSRKEKG